MSHNYDEIRASLEELIKKTPLENKKIREDIKSKLTELESLIATEASSTTVVRLDAIDKLHRLSEDFNSVEKSNEVLSMIVKEKFSEMLPDEGETKRYDVNDAGWFTIDSNGLLVSGSQQLYKDFIDGKFSTPKKTKYNLKKVMVGILIMVPLTGMLLIKTYQGIQNTLINPAVNAVEWLHSDWNNTSHWSK